MVKFTLIVLILGLALGSVVNAKDGAVIALTPIESGQAEIWKFGHGLQARAKVRKQAEADELPSIAYLPWVAVGVENGKRYFPTITVLNGSAEPMPVTIEFFDNHFQPLEMPFANEDGTLAGYFSSAAGEIPPGAVAGPMIANINERLRTGWARITYSSTSPAGINDYISIQDGSRLGVLIPRAADPYFTPIDVLVENNRAGKITWLNLVNPSEYELELEWRARTPDGQDICSGTLKLDSGGQLIQTAQRLVTCMPAGRGNYILTIEPLDGEVVAAAWYDYGQSIMHVAPVHEVQPASFDTPEIEDLKAQALAKAPLAASTLCRPTFDPLQPRLTSDSTEIEVEINFAECDDPDQGWIFRKSSTVSWYTLVDSRDREVGHITGAGSATILIRIDEAAAKKYGGTRRGTIYLNQFATGRAGRTIGKYSFSQPIPKL